jgi:uncharacterized cupredoxin-like copper-binding protein
MRFVQNGFNARRTLATFGLVGLTTIGLAACGGAAETPTPLATPTVAAIATATPGMAGMADTPETSALPAEQATAEPTAEATAEATATAGTSGDTGVGTDGSAVETPAASADGSTAGQTTQVQAVLKEWAIDLSQAEVPAGKIQFTVTNEGQMRHNLAILGESGQIARTPDFAPSDGAQTLEVELTPGTYTIICNLPGHAQRGQRTEIVVK